MVGASQWVIEAEVAKKKEEYLNNQELVQIFKLYKSKKVISIPVNNLFFFFPPLCWLSF